jgi:hypothetical protein
MCNSKPMTRAPTTNRSTSTPKSEVQKQKQSTSSTRGTCCALGAEQYFSMEERLQLRVCIHTPVLSTAQSICRTRVREAAATAITSSTTVLNCHCIDQCKIASAAVHELCHMHCHCYAATTAPSAAAASQVQGQPFL